MFTHRTLSGIALLTLSSSALWAADLGAIAAGAKLEKLAGGFTFTEGPASDSQGNVFFTDQPNDRIVRWGVDGQTADFLKPCGRANGLCFDASGRIWACADEKNELWIIQPDGKHEVLIRDYEGKRLNGPNDVWIREDGAVFFTDPFYKRPYWTRSGMEQDKQCVYLLAPDRTTLRRIADDLQQPNGIIGTRDGKLLYVADIGAKKTYAYDVREDGSLVNKRLFCEMGSDGMTVDNEGNVYLTGNGVTVFNSKGEQINHIPVPERWTANVCFGGRDRHLLFITASTAVYGITMRTSGVGSQ